ncbi:unnamed protein product [Bursaphelenchus okinawaensis]|uniref:Peptidase A1 domain-containing protein n=1 Tax=Bursaphelenchus okinawaensis TaxID=465554 RepID=A0A811LF73_9BILA|nr:unnamed protein product [Bursaphelenchus okinawaensis]CAG9121910.1 unnamed protein product [Bursaphelenchus okinawaensis]
MINQLTVCYSKMKKYEPLHLHVSEREEEEEKKKEKEEKKEEKEAKKEEKEEQKEEKEEYRSNSLKLNESELYFNFLGNVNLNGARAQEDITLASTTFKAQNVGVVRKATGEGTLTVSGVLGVGPTINGTDGSGDSWEPIVHQIARKQSNGKFTVWLNSNEDSDVKGQLTFADHDEEHCEKEVVQAGPLVKARGQFSQWAFPVQRYGSDKYRYFREGNVAIQNDDKIIKMSGYILDTIARIYRLNKDTKLDAYVTKCDEIEKFTPFFLTINKKDFEFPAKILFTPTGDNGMCRFIAEQGQQGPLEEVFQLTQDFLKHLCVTYDVNSKTVAFAKAIAK